MKRFFLIIIILIYVLPAVAHIDKCASEITGYKVVKGTIYPFTVDKEKACFFAFYTRNPYPMIDSNGNGNKEDAIWYAYYMKNDPKKIYEFPKPVSDQWRRVCTINAISFVSMYGDGKRDVTVIGSCDRNKKNYTYPFVFNHRGKIYVVDDQLSIDLNGIIGLTIADVQKYIKDFGYLFKLYNRYLS